LNKKGVSLVELLVYIVLFALVTMLIGTQLKQLVKSYSSGRRISKLQSDSRDVLAMMSREIRNAGCKTYLVATNPDEYSTQVASGTFLPDSSSFIHSEGNPGDELTIYKASLSNTGDLESVEQIRYFLEGTTLFRESSGEKLELAENVYSLQFQYGVFDLEDDLLIENSASTANWIVEGTLNILKDDVNQSFEITKSLTGILKCTRTFSIDTAEHILIQFKITPSNGFPENVDSIWCTIRSDWAVLAKEPFKLTDKEMKIKMPVAKSDKAYISFDIYSKGAGTVKIESLKVKRADLGYYLWKDDPPENEKKAVKAIKIYALVRSKETVDSKDETPIAVGNITVTRSGNYAWRMYTETVEVVNNGIF